MVSSIAADLARAFDPVLLARRAGVIPDPWQADLLRSDARRSILLCSRQSGKSTTSAVLATHQAVYSPGSLVLVLSPSPRQSQELYRKIRDTYSALAGAVPKPAEESAIGLELANGSRIVSLPGMESTIRGFSGAALLLVDEASRVPDALYQAVRPMLTVSGGRIVLLSTPFDKRGFFHHDLRHTAATLLLAQGVHPKVVSEMLGHATITLTLDTYSYLVPVLHEQAAAMDTLLGA